jgi:hypothetical protein
MTDSAFAKYDLLKKPNPGVTLGRMVQKPAIRGEIDIEVTLVDKTDRNFDRAKIMERLKALNVVRIPKEVSRVERKPIISRPTSVRIKVQKKGTKIRLGKTIRKGTITAIKPMPIKIKVGKRRVQVKLSLGKVEGRTRTDVPSSLIKIGDGFIKDRLLAVEPSVNIKASAYYMNNREIFINFITSLFEPYKEMLIEESKDITCDRPSGSFTLMTHQQIVRDYINLFTPYRGLLLYHGLGAGKTCASISIAEGIKTRKGIIVMTPASLRQNYISELKMCGDPLYRLNQFWEFLPTAGNPSVVQELSQILNLSHSYIKKAKGAWFVNVKKESNYDNLSTPDKILLNEQIDEMISAKYQFISYNGLRKSHLGDLLNMSETDNPFDDKVIIIDEAHNFVSRIVNKIKKKDSMSYKLYEYLMSAENCKIVFLTGTPIINYPNEIGIMFNILRGYIKTFIFTVNVQTSKSVTQETIESAFKSFAIHDYIDYDSSAKTITMTRNPFGFVSVDNGEYMGVKKNQGGNTCEKKNKNRDCQSGYICEESKCVPMSDVAFVGICRSILQSKGVQITGVQNKLYKALPDTLSNFNAMFINPKTGEIKNKNLFQKRILGLTSYFRSAAEGLMPDFEIEEDLKIIDIDMSDYQFGLYEEARSNERELESRNAKKKKMQVEGGVYSDTVSTYRIFSRAFCNFVFPREILRPMKNEGQDLKTAILEGDQNEDDLDATSVSLRVLNVDGKYEADDEEVLVEKVDKSYPQRIKAALDDLRINSARFLTPSALKTYSPKFLTILTNILDEENIGLNLVYSQFRTLEGIGIFALVLEQNGFVQFKIKKVAGEWQIAIPPEKQDWPTYALYTGTEDAEEKEIVRNIYNGDWDKIPNSIKTYLQGKSENNHHGEIIKVFMITSSGAEGITLKNTRYVHITEPYWHPVRIEQVIGRARRICSHNQLSKEEQNVKVFVYLMKFTNKQLVPISADGMASKELLQKDVSKLDKSTPLTSDQALFEISTIKEGINKQILSAVKGSSIDCSLHTKGNDPVICMSFGAVNSGKFTSTPALTNEREFDKQEERNMKWVEWDAEEVTLGGRLYALKRFNTKLSPSKAPEGELYDMDSYERAIKKLGAPVLVGYLRIDDATGKLKKSRT